MMSGRQVRVLVADDEPLSLSLACSTIAVDPRLVVAAQCNNGQSVLDALAKNDVDVAVLDINMPRVDGLALSQLLAREQSSPEIVFVTAHSQHALEAFDLGVSDYVTKPYDGDRLRRAVLRAAARRHAQAQGTSLAPMEKLLVRSRTGTHLLAFSEIELIDADEKEVWIQANDRRFRYSSTISAMERMLPCPPFVRTHRSHIVNLDHVSVLNDANNGTGAITLKSGAVSPISRRYRRRLSALFFARP
ncbi:MAG: LytR/AlgR family response regulator transcription factor [Hyphomonadaceae bacterium]